MGRSAELYEANCVQDAESRAMDAEYEAWQIRQELPYEPTREEQAEYRQMLDRDDAGRQPHEKEGIDHCG